MAMGIDRKVEWKGEKQVEGRSSKGGLYTFSLPSHRLHKTAWTGINYNAADSPGAPRAAPPRPASASPVWHRPNTPSARHHGHELGGAGVHC